MPRNGSGSYSLVSGQPVVTGTVISSSVHNALAADIAAELTNSLDKDGQTVVTGNIDFNGLALILDPTGNTKIQAGTDNILVITINNAADFELRANILRALLGSVIQTNTINETTSGSGVTIEGVLVKDSGVNGTLGATTPAAVAGTTLGITGAFTAGTAAWAVGTNQLVKGTDGNFGIGVTPSATSGGVSLELGTSGLHTYLASFPTLTTLAQNYYFNGSADIYTATGVASRYYQLNGEHVWQAVASGTGGNSIGTWGAEMRLDTAGVLSVPQAYTSAVRQRLISWTIMKKALGLLFYETVLATLSQALQTQAHIQKSAI